VPQLSDEDAVADSDPLRVARYACEEAQIGNFAPMLQVFSTQEIEELRDPSKRCEMATELGMNPEDAEAMSPQELVTEWLRANFWKRFLYIDVTVSPEGPTRAHYAAHRFGGSSGGTLVLKDGRWRAGR